MNEKLTFPLRFFLLSSMISSKYLVNLNSQFCHQASLFIYIINFRKTDFKRALFFLFPSGAQISLIQHQRQILDVSLISNQITRWPGPRGVTTLFVQICLHVILNISGSRCLCFHFSYIKILRKTTERILCNELQLYPEKFSGGTATFVLANCSFTFWYDVYMSSVITTRL